MIPYVFKARSFRNKTLTKVSPLTDKVIYTYGQMGEVYTDGVGDLGHLGLCVLPGS